MMEEAASSDSFVEGIGDEVLASLAIGGGLIILMLAWSSTRLTHTQARLNNPRLMRTVHTNRVPPPIDSEQTEVQQQSTSAVPPMDENPASPSADQAIHGETPIDDNVIGRAAMPSVSTSQQPEEQGANSELSQTANVTSIPEEPEGTTSAEEQNEAVPEGFFRVRLKFLSEAERTVLAKKNDRISAFKRRHFAQELRDNKLVRLIYNGQVIDDSRTMESYSITDSTVVHALISDNAANQNSTQGGGRGDPAIFNAGVFMVPIIGSILAIFWYLRLEFPRYFTATSTGSLAAITGVFIISLLAQNRHRQNMQAQQTHHYDYTVNAPTGT